MNKTAFVQFLKSCELPSENVYEDISEVGTVLWHNDRLALKITCAVESSPCVSLVVKHPDGDYSYFASELDHSRSADVMNIIAYAKEHADAIYELAIASDQQLRILVTGQEWRFIRQFS